MDARSILSTYGVKIINPKTVAYDFHAISSLFHLAFYIRAFAPFELSAPITITHYPGPGGVPIIKHSYYFKPIGGCEMYWYTALPTMIRQGHSHADKQLNRTFLLPTTIRRISRIFKGERLLYHELP